MDDETAEHTPFSVWCSMPVGRLPDLMSSAAAASPMVWDDLDSDLHVVITRELGRLFDGVNFETMSADGVQLRLLKSLSAQTIITANPVPPP